MKRSPQVRAQLEFDVITDQIKRRKEQFMARLNRNIREEPGPMATPCKVWTGTASGGKYGKTYPVMNFRLTKTSRDKSHICIGVHRVFLILMLGRPIGDGFECGHTCHNSMCVTHVEEQTRQFNLFNRYSDRSV